jgi:thiamine monophosphate synthase
MNPVDLRLYAIVDPENAGGKSLAELARQVAEGGATLVQLRDKLSDTGTPTLWATHAAQIDAWFERVEFATVRSRE